MVKNIFLHLGLGFWFGFFFFDQIALGLVPEEGLWSQSE